MTALLDLLLHLDTYLIQFVAAHGTWVYGLLIAVIFAETGLVIAPWLPGDSLLFVVGTLAGAGSIDYGVILPVLMAASFSGDTTNYFIGRYVGEHLCQRYPRWFKPEYLERTHAFYQAHGGKTLVIARFMPIVRTFAPFVAGIGNMDYSRFALFSIGGSVLWVGSLVSAGYLLGNQPWVKANLLLIIIFIVILSLLPALIGYWQQRKHLNSEG